MIKKLVPKEEKYFEYFNQLSSLLEEIASGVNRLYTEFKNIVNEIVADLKEKEQLCPLFPPITFLIVNSSIQYI
ncbi:MAG: hypothetical protein ACK4G1_01645 [Ignavibacteria bacterium]